MLSLHLMCFFDILCDVFNQFYIEKNDNSTRESIGITGVHRGINNGKSKELSLYSAGDEECIREKLFDME